MSDLLEWLRFLASGQDDVHSVAIAAAADRIEALEADARRYLAQRDHERAKLDRAVKMLTGIHSLLYPAPIELADGRTMVFRPTDTDPHATLQLLSDRIRAIPDELDAAIAQQTAQEGER